MSSNFFARCFEWSFFKNKIYFHILCSKIYEIFSEFSVVPKTTRWIFEEISKTRKKLCISQKSFSEQEISYEKSFVRFWSSKTTLSYPERNLGRKSFGVENSEKLQISLEKLHGYPRTKLELHATIFFPQIDWSEISFAMEGFVGSKNLNLKTLTLTQIVWDHHHHRHHHHSLHRHY